MATVPTVKRLFEGHMTYPTAKDFTPAQPQQKKNAAPEGKVAKPTVAQLDELAQLIATAPVPNK